MPSRMRQVLAILPEIISNTARPLRITCLKRKRNTSRLLVIDCKIQPSLFKTRLSIIGYLITALLDYIGPEKIEIILISIFTHLESCDSPVRPAAIISMYIFMASFLSGLLSKYTYPIEVRHLYAAILVFSFCSLTHNII